MVLIVLIVAIIMLMEVVMVSVMVLGSCDGSDGVTTNGGGCVGGHKRYRGHWVTLCLVIVQGDGGGYGSLP